MSPPASAPPDPSAARARAAPVFDSAALLRDASTRPGVYLMRNQAGEVLYVGKARNLRLRLRSYFRSGEQQAPKVRALLARVQSVDLLLSASEAEALVLESELIKRHRPRYNHLFRDDKSYPYIHQTTGHDFPRLCFHRGARSGPGRYFGPYPDTGAVRSTLRLAQKLFKIRDCSDSMFQNRSRPCLQYQIDRCSAPCVKLVNRIDYAANLRRATLFLQGRNEQVIEELTAPMRAAAGRLDYEAAARYRDLIARLRVVQERHQRSKPGRDADLAACRLEGGHACVMLSMVRNGVHLGSCSFFPRHLGMGGEEQVLSAFLAQHYLQGGGATQIPSEILVSHALPDRAALADALGKRLGCRVRIRRVPRGTGPEARLLQTTLENASYKLRLHRETRQHWEQRWAELAELPGLDKAPERIECFDISHTGGESTTASCVVFSAAGALPAFYRRYNIKGIAAGDDCAALRRAVRRRYRRGARESTVPPEFLLVDGGAHQLRVVRAALGELGYDTEMAGLAKGPGRKPELDSLWLGEPPRSLRLSPGAPLLLLLQRIRDEAHRFAVVGHRRQRAAASRSSILEQVEGIGRLRRQRLLQHFGGLRGVSSAGVRELTRVPGIHLRLARRIHELLHPDSEN